MPSSPPLDHLDPGFNLREIVGDPGIADAMSAFSRLRFAHARLLDGLAHRFGVTATDIRALFYLAANHDVTPTSAAEFLGLTTGAVTSLVDRNERAGLMVRAAHSRDRRSIVLRLTAEGDRAVATWSEQYRGAFAAAVPAASLGVVTDAFVRLAEELGSRADAVAGVRESS